MKRCFLDGAAVVSGHPQTAPRNKPNKVQRLHQDTSLLFVTTYSRRRGVLPEAKPETAGCRVLVQAARPERQRQATKTIVETVETVRDRSRDRCKNCRDRQRP